MKGSVGFCVRAGAVLGRVGAVGSAAGAGSRTGSSEAVEHRLGAGRCVLPLLPCSKTAALRTLERPNHLHHCHQQLCFPVTGRNTAVPLPIIGGKRFINHRDLISLSVKTFLPPTLLAFKFGLRRHAEATEKHEEIQQRNTLKSHWNKTVSDGAAA